MTEAVHAAVAAMGWLKDSDAGTVALALRYAGQIDAAKDLEPAEAMKALYLGPHLLNALRALGGAPGERKALGVEEEVHGKLAQLRSIRGGRAS